MVREGQVLTTRLMLRRVDYDHKFQAALTKIQAKDKGTEAKENIEEYQESDVEA